MTTPPFSLNPKQVEANRLLGSTATHALLRGGSRSGKTFVLIRALILRGLKAPGSRHGAFRHAFNHIKQSVVLDTLPKVMSLCFPDIRLHMNQTDWFATLPNESEIWFGGLDEKERVEKILGKEFATIFLNECSQISYDARNKVITRLAQRVATVDGKLLALKAYYDCNPPIVSHWTYKLFEQKIEPKSGEPLANPGAYVTMQLNPDANRDNLAPEYLAELEGLPEKDRRRFLLGEYLSQVDNALWAADAWRRDAAVTDDNIEETKKAMRRIVIAVDPSGCEGEEDFRSDEIGVTVNGVDRAGDGHLLEDASGRYSPERWGRLVTNLYAKWGADLIVAERNYGGALVESTIRATRDGKNLPVKMVTASRGKHVRAEPVSALYEKRRIIHHGRFPDLEDQLCQFSAAGYQGAKSPDRADAHIWGLTELMLGEVQIAPQLMPFSLHRR